MLANVLLSCCQFRYWTKAKFQRGIYGNLSFIKCQSIMVRRVQILTAVWFRHLISAVNWLWSLVLNVGTLSCSLAFTLLEDGYSWWK
ncbi:unnamed protein product, partial [Allacma fusca]